MALRVSRTNSQAPIMLGTLKLFKGYEHCSLPCPKGLTPRFLVLQSVTLYLIAVFGRRESHRAIMVPPDKIKRYRPAILMMSLAFGLLQSCSGPVDLPEGTPEFDLLKLYPNFTWEKQKVSSSSNKEENVLLEYHFDGDHGEWSTSVDPVGDPALPFVKVQPPEGKEGYILSPPGLNLPSRAIGALLVSLKSDARAIIIDYRLKDSDHFFVRSRCKLYNPAPNQYNEYLITTSDIRLWPGVIDQFKIAVYRANHLEINGFRVYPGDYRFQEDYGIQDYALPSALLKGGKVQRPCVYVKGSNAFTLPPHHAY